MLTVVGRRLQGTCWSALIFFWRDIFYPYMPFRFGISERRCNHIAIKRLFVARAYSFFISYLGSSFSFFSTLSSFLGFFFHFLFFLWLFLLSLALFSALMGYVIVEA